MLNESTGSVSVIADVSIVKWANLKSSENDEVNLLLATLLKQSFFSPVFFTYAILVITARNSNFLKLYSERTNKMCPSDKLCDWCNESTESGVENVNHYGKVIRLKSLIYLDNEKSFDDHLLFFLDFYQSQLPL